MGRLGQLVGSAAVAVGAVLVLAEVRNGFLDVADGALLIAALAIFARTLIRIASEPPGPEQDRDDQPSLSR
jgi:hypothetical protein